MVLCLYLLVGCVSATEEVTQLEEPDLGASDSEPVMKAMEAAKKSITVIKTQASVVAALKTKAKLKKAFGKRVKAEKKLAAKEKKAYDKAMKAAEKPLAILSLQENIISHLKLAQNNESQSVTANGGLSNATAGEGAATFAPFTPPYIAESIKKDSARFKTDLQAQFFATDSNKITMRSFNAKVREAKDLGPNKGVSLKIACSKSGCASLSSDSMIQDGGPTDSTDKKDFNWGCETAATISTEACQGCSCKGSDGFAQFARVLYDHQLTKGKENMSCRGWFARVDSGVKQFVEAMRGQVKSIKAKQCTAVAEPLTSKEGNPPAAAPAAGKKPDTGGKKEE